MIRRNPKALNKKRSLGQGMTEYIIIVGVIAVAAIGVFGFLGDAIQEQTAGLATEISGGDAGAQITASQAAATNAAAAADTHKSLANYNQNSQAAAGGN